MVESQCELVMMTIHTRYIAPSIRGKLGNSFLLLKKKKRGGTMIDGSLMTKKKKMNNNKIKKNMSRRWAEIILYNGGGVG